MCCIAICETTRLTPGVLDKMTKVNSDGLGIGWVADKKCYWAKGIDEKQAKKMVAHIPLPYVVHARLATIGGKEKALAHPFAVEAYPSLKLSGGSKRGLFFHNGHVSNWKCLLEAAGDPVEGKEDGVWSDSRAIAHIIAKRGSAKILDHLCDMSRFAILLPSGVVRWGHWHEQDGIKLSSYLMDHTDAALISVDSRWDEVYAKWGKRRYAKTHGPCGRF